MKKIEIQLLEKPNVYRNERNTEFKDLVKKYAEIQNKLKALEETVQII